MKFELLEHLWQNEMFKKYKEKWEIRTLLKKQRAQEFWRKVVKDASRGNYEEHFIRDNTRYAFYFEKLIIV